MSWDAVAFRSFWMVGSAMLSTVLSRTTTSRLTTSTRSIAQRLGWPSSVGTYTLRGVGATAVGVGCGSLTVQSPVLGRNGLVSKSSATLAQPDPIRNRSVSVVLGLA